jgi:hypothetical protein
MAAVKLLAAALALLGMTAVQHASADEHLDATKGRLVISRTGTAGITVVDLDDGNRVATVPDAAAGPAVYTTDDGIFTVVTHSTLGRIRFFDSGIRVNAANAVTKSTPKFMRYEATGTVPAHVYSDFNWCERGEARVGKCLGLC